MPQSALEAMAWLFSERRGPVQMPGIGIQMSERWVGGWMELADRRSKYSGNRRVFLAAGTGSFLILSVRTPGVP